ncbi:polyamine ABC transporter ATP-binding protein [Terasakiella sp. SH-1]|uniref:ABC transporter ATP-binding protein n=1 Tax=Terasakiella sp. SH-1 TaxID=2560057 RepID=UPI0010745CF0|nr:polyamine ABC transporter ATP-binding protein [Terasakiella sp. SH-1]
MSLQAEAIQPEVNETEPFIQIKNVTKKFGDFVAVNDISLDIYQSELFCLLGGSGSGKSTLLRMLAGFETPTSGQIIIDGVDMADIPPWKRPINMMFQSYALFPHLSVEANIAFGLKREGVPSGEIKQRVQEMIELVQLTKFAKRKPDQLSGGQRQRVALARALIKRPKVLLLDEPLGALDKKLREETQFELINIQESLGVTFVVVTHDQEEAMTLASRMAVMNEGEIEQLGKPHEVYEYPTSRFVAEFIGSVNIFDGHVAVDEPDHVMIESKEAGSNLYVSHGISCSPNQKVGVAVRPEKVIISHTKSEYEYNCCPGEIVDIAYMGNMSVFKVRLDTGKNVRITRFNRERSEDERFTWNDKVFLTWGPTSCVVLTS